MLFPLSGVEVTPLVPIIAAFSISFVCSMGGVSGAFLLLPFQVTCLGYTSPSVSATNQLFNLLATPSGILRYLKEGRMLWPLAIALAAGTLPGVVIGAWLRLTWLPDPEVFAIFAACVLLFVAWRLFISLHKGNTKSSTQGPLSMQVQSYAKLCLRYRFQDQEFSCPLGQVFAISLLIGVTGGAYGIGGGAIMSPILVARFRLPIQTISAATLFSTFVTSLTSLLFFSMLAPLYPHLPVQPDWQLGLCLALGGMGGMYCGAFVQRFVSSRLLSYLLLVIILLAAALLVF